MEITTSTFYSSDVFEDISKDVKKTKFTSTVDTILDKVDKTTEVQLAESQKALFEVNTKQFSSVLEWHLCSYTVCIYSQQISLCYCYNVCILLHVSKPRIKLEPGAVLYPSSTNLASSVLDFIYLIA